MAGGNIGGCLKEDSKSVDLVISIFNHVLKQLGTKIVIAISVWIGYTDVQLITDTLYYTFIPQWIEFRTRPSWVGDDRIQMAIGKNDTSIIEVVFAEITEKIGFDDMKLMFFPRRCEFLLYANICFLLNTRFSEDSLNWIYLISTHGN